MKKFLLYIFLTIYSISHLQAQKTDIFYTPNDSVLVENLLRRFTEQYSSSIEKQVLQIGNLFVETPYVGKTLEKAGKEQLIVNLREMDCTTFVETVTALVLSIQNNTYSFRDYCSNLQKIRYRNSIINGYPSRLHYFSDWIQNNIQKGIIKEVTPKEGSLIQKQSINFMSSHADKYTPLTENVLYLEEIKNIEKQLSNIPIRYIPKDSLNSHNISQIHNGDIIAITTSIKGLDISHVGFAYWIKDKLHLLHASLNKKRVIIENIPLNKQLQQYKSQSGIRVLRIIKKAVYQNSIIEDMSL
ncbi:N-acetylmuramoyl-L-alanine amidase-like domain-containing protein [Coprobacter sp.]|uniref:N-acetylmuramoyl-L-alanine amidase-like domain-containing protein n=1 Tax=Coprobacter sp. TaxID=1941478 RepID=UPI003AB70A74